MATERLSNPSVSSLNEITFMLPYSIFQNIKSKLRLGYLMFPGLKK